MMTIIHSRWQILWQRWVRFWFQPVSANGFGLMRILYGISTLIVFTLQWPVIQSYYGNTGIISSDAAAQFLRSTNRFSLLDYVSSVEIVSALYVLLLIALVFVTIGLFTRTALITSTIIVFSFHEYATVILDGGDTMIRIIAFMLLISGCDRAFSVRNLRYRYWQWMHTHLDQPASERTIPAWPYRLLLWQMTVLYISSTFLKLKGDMWLDGTAAGSVLFHSNFSRVPFEIAATLFPFSAPLTYFTLIVQGLWILIPIVGILSFFFPMFRPDRLPVKRALLLSGFFMHMGIALTMDVGMFSFLMLAAYAGLLTDDDIEAARSLFRGKRTGKIIVLYDGHCRLCRRTVFALTIVDYLKRFQYVNLHEKNARETYAPKIPMKELMHAMHIRLPDGTFQKGYDAFRILSRHTPVTVAFSPLLRMPVIDRVGNRIYEQVAAKRVTCGEECRM